MKIKDQVRQISKKLAARGEMLGLAESCTGGQISALLTSLPGASKVFQGAVISYTNKVKHDVLGVSEKLLKSHGPVSREVVLQMARGALKVLDCDWVVSVTGVAGPAGGTKKTPVGLVFYAVVGPRVAVVVKKVFSGTRKDIQKKATERSVQLLLRKLK